VFLHASPIDVSAIVREKVLGQVDAAVFTSATLATAGSFEFVRARLGLESAMEARLPSPFDYRAQAILYLPKDLPEPAEESFAEAVAERMGALVEITDGRAFLLFTSHRQMQRVHQLLAPKLKQKVLLQGDMPKHLLVEEFKKNVGSVLFATASFWEGVDVIGEALSLVVIDKLPFAPPDDPLVAARARKLEEQGTDPFGAYHLPRAALQLAQGFGRLIRHRGDRGIVALLDRRAATKSYGKRVLGSLPAECPRTDSLDAVRAFWGKPC
jgi:ATP-dependent DNA helicase DinG